MISKCLFSMLGMHKIFRNPVTKHDSCQPQPPIPVLEYVDGPPWGQGITDSIPSLLQTGMTEGSFGSVSLNTCWPQGNRLKKHSFNPGLQKWSLIMGSVIQCQRKTLEKDYDNTERQFYHLSFIHLRQQFLAYWHHSIYEYWPTHLAFSLKGKPVTLMLRILEWTNKQQRGRVQPNSKPCQISPIISKP